MDCPRIPEMPYSDFSDRLHRKGTEWRLPLGASVEITERCNLNCAHCYINLPANDKEAREKELGFSQWARIIDDMVAEGCLWLLLTGGEPLLHPDFREIYTFAKKQGMLITLFTNGTLITPETADFLRDYPPFVIEITIYGFTKATFDAVTRAPGSYEKCVRGIELLLARQIPLELKTTITTTNVRELQDMTSWAQRLGVKFRCDPVLQPRLDGGKEPLAWRLAAEQGVEIDLQDEYRRSEWKQLAEKFQPSVDSGLLYSCGAGISSFHLNSYGLMYPCMMSRSVSFDLTKGNFIEGWRDVIPRVRQQKPHGEYACGQCELSLFCNYCPPWANLEEGNAELPVSYLCKLAQMRAEAFGVFTNNNKGGLENEPSIQG